MGHLPFYIVARIIINVWRHVQEWWWPIGAAILGGRINSRDVWMYNSQLNIWIRVASLNKGRWRHKMAVLLGKVSW